MRDEPVVSVIIVNFNTSEDTVACVQSVAENTTVPAETIVVDNGSIDDSVAALRARTNATVVPAGENLGFAKGVNRGVGHARARWVLLLNPDAVVLPGTIDALVGFAEQHPEFGMYGGRTLRRDGSTDPSSCWGDMTLWSLVCFATGASTAFKRSRLLDPESLGRWQRDSQREVPVITGCLLLIAREDFNRLGGLDERYFLYGEDAEFSVRARRHGLRPVIVPQATIIHDVGGSTSSSGKKMCMVMAGRATMLRLAWTRRRAAVGLALLQAGAATRHLLERMAGRGRGATWGVVWRRRRQWRLGYPEARPYLFGSGSASGSGPTSSGASSVARNP